MLKMDRNIRNLIDLTKYHLFEIDIRLEDYKDKLDPEFLDTVEYHIKWTRNSLEMLNDKIRELNNKE